ncbi:MAG: hypothetical protein OXC18_24170 [Desulfurellaceae bacterium]|nr:hypothetical protein [Desulfurellaceae bacterium]
MPVQPPTLEEIVDIAEGYGLSLTDADTESFQGLMNGIMKSYARLDALTAKFQNSSAIFFQNSSATLEGNMRNREIFHGEIS